MCAGFAARGRSELQGRELHWSAPVKLTAVQFSPWLRASPTSPHKPPHINTEKGAHQHTTNNQETAEARNAKAKAKRGEEVKAKGQSD